MKRLVLLTVTLAFMSLPATLLAMSHGEGGGSMNGGMTDHGSMQMDHDGMKMDHSSMQMSGNMIMLGMQEEDGVKANIHMKDVSAKMAEMGMDTTHHFMVALTDAKTGKTLDKGVVAVKITDPAGHVSKAMKLMGMQGHFGLDVTLKDPGEYHFEIATKLEDGKTRKFEASYTK